MYQKAIIQVHISSSSFFFLVTCLLVPEARKVSEAGDPTTTTLGRLLHAKLDSGYLLSHGKT
jgi:hypothetical protein